uniref:Uncharacterized protein n=1 Tax=Salix viminalis TaxID=40686 RepID=A0A6N2L295_SALVM
MALAIAKSPKTKIGFSRFISDALPLPPKIAGGICIAIAIAMHAKILQLFTVLFLPNKQISENSGVVVDHNGLPMQVLSIINSHVATNPHHRS